MSDRSLAEIRADLRGLSTEDAETMCAALVESFSLREIGRMLAEAEVNMNADQEGE